MPALTCHRLLLLLLLWVAAASHGDSSDDGTYDPSMCLNQTSACGSVSISYPFYLSGETKDLKGNDNSYCGYPGLGILCDDDKPILQLDGAANYTVKSIAGANATVSLADPAVDDDDNICPRPRIYSNITLQQGFLVYLSDSTVHYLVFFIGCAFNSTFHRPDNIPPISCEGFDDDGPGPGLSFVLPDDAVPPGNWVQACNRVIQLPVQKHGAINHTDPGWANGGYASVLRQEFQLGWNESGKPPGCIQCEGSGSMGRCGYSRTGDFIGCLCPDGRVRSDNTCNQARKFFESEAFSFAQAACFYLVCSLPGRCNCVFLSGSPIIAIAPVSSLNMVICRSCFLFVSRRSFF